MRQSVRAHDRDPCLRRAGTASRRRSPGAGQGAREVPAQGSSPAPTRPDSSGAPARRAARGRRLRPDERRAICRSPTRSARSHARTPRAGRMSWLYALLAKTAPVPRIDLRSRRAGGRPSRGGPSANSLYPNRLNSRAAVSSLVSVRSENFTGSSGSNEHVELVSDSVRQPRELRQTRGVADQAAVRRRTARRRAWCRRPPFAGLRRRARRSPRRSDR